MITIDTFDAITVVDGDDLSLTPLEIRTTETPNVRDTSTGTGNAQNADITLPTSIFAGDTLYVVLGWDGSVGSSTWPAGWTKRSDDGVSCRIVTAWKKADGSEGGTTIQVTRAFTIEQYVYECYSLSEAIDPSVQVPQEASSDGTSANPDPASLTPTGGAKDYLWYVAVTLNNIPAITDYPDGYTIGQTERVNGTAVKIAIARKEARIATDDPTTFTIDTSGGWGASTWAFHPNPGADDVVTVADVATLAMSLITLNTFETITVTDVANSVLTINTSEAITVTDARTLSVTLTISTSDSITVAESSTLPVLLLIDTFDTITAAEFVNVGIGIDLSIFESISVLDGTTDINFGESVSVADAFITDLAIDDGDVITVVDVASQSEHAVIDLPEEILVEDASTLLFFKEEPEVDIGESFTITDFANASVSVFLDVSESISVAESEFLAGDPLGTLPFDSVSVSEFALLVGDPLGINTGENIGVTDLLFVPVVVPQIGLLNTELRDARALGKSLAFLTELDIGGITIRASNTGVASDDLGFYGMRVTNYGSLDRQVSEQGMRLREAQIRVTIEDNTGQIDAIAEGRFGRTLRGSAARVKLVAERIEPTSFFTVFSGEIDTFGKTGLHTWNFSLHGTDKPLRGLMKLTPITQDHFKDANTDFLGDIIPVVYGTFDSQGIGPGMLKTFHTSTVLHQYIVSTGIINITKVFVDDVFTSSGFSTVTVEAAGRVFTAVQFDTAQLEDGKTKKITVDATGITDVGDGTGLLIDNGAEQVQHALVNFLYNEWKRGTYFAVSTSPLNAAAFSKVAAFLADRSVKSSRVVIEQTGGNLLNEFCLEHQFPPFWTNSGELAIAGDEYAIDVVGTTLPWFKDDGQIGQPFKYTYVTSMLADEISVQHLFWQAENKFARRITVKDTNRTVGVREELSLHWSLASTVI